MSIEDAYIYIYIRGQYKKLVTGVIFLFKFVHESFGVCTQG